MNKRARVIFSLIQKDLSASRSFILFTIGVFLLGPVFELLSEGSQNEAIGILSDNLFLSNFFVLSLLTVTLFHIDPATSLNHDWLTRPISRVDLLIGKLLILLLVTIVPTVIARTAVNLASGYSFLAALLESTIISDAVMLLFLPAIAVASLVTKSLKSAVAIFVGLVVFTSLPGIGFDRIGDNPLRNIAGLEGVDDFGGMEWLQNIPLIALMSFGFLLVYWVQYQQRDLRKAWVVIVVSATLTMMLSYPPGSLITWETAFGIQQAASNDGGESALEDIVVLDHTYACFPAASLELSPVDGPQFNGTLDPSLYWASGTFESAKDGAVAFATTVSNRADEIELLKPQHLGFEIPINWRTVALKAYGTYSSNILDEDVRIRASGSWRANRVIPSSNVITSHWLIDGDLHNELAKDPSTKFTIDYSLALLSPTSYEVEPDDVQRFYPELGYCKAATNNLYDRIDIECFKKGEQPTLISAELPGIRSSRVDSGLPSYTPRWLELLSGKRYNWSMPSRSLSPNSSIILTAYNQELFFNKQVTSSGVLGGTENACSLLDDTRDQSLRETAWADRSTHQSSLITVDENVQLEVLDWGYAGADEKASNVVLLAGLGATAHVFDEIAPKLSKEHHVVGITRRGYGTTATPESGFDVSRLAEDVIQVLTTLELDNVLLVGHSFASEEMNYLASNFPTRFKGLVYLDAAYDRTSSQRMAHEMRLAIPPIPPPYRSEFSSYKAAQEYFRRVGVSGYLPEGEIMASYDLTNGTPLSSASISQAIGLGIQSPNYDEIHLPALAIYAVPSSKDSLLKPWYNTDDAKLNEALNIQYQLEIAFKTQQINQFQEQVFDSDVIVLEDAGHSLFLTNENDVLDAIGEFSDKLR